MDHGMIRKTGERTIDLRDRRRVTASSFPWHKVDFHPRKTATAIITINAGWIFVGTQVPVAVNGASRTISATGQWLWVAYNYSTNGATIPTPSDVLPQNENHIVIWPIALTSLSEGGVCAIERYAWLGGSIHLPGTYAR